jgi:hypothetical protein
MLAARHFTILTEQKPLNFAFHQRSDKYLPRQFNNLDFILQYITHVRHISGKENVVADNFPY